MKAFISADTWKILNNYDRINNIDLNTKIVELKVYDESILKYMPILPIQPWIKEGITLI